MKGQSELGRLVENIDREAQAAYWALHATNLGTAKHRFISRRMEGIGRAHGELSELVGKNEAMQIVVDRMNELVSE